MLAAILALVLIVLPIAWLARRVARHDLRPGILVTGAVAIAIAHFVAYFGLWSVSFASYTAATGSSWLPSAVLFALGTPLMHLLYIGPHVLSSFSPWPVSDAGLLIGFAVANAMLWGTVVTWYLRRREKRPVQRGL